MIRGKTTKELNREGQLRLAQAALSGVRKFAWFNTELNDGREVWLQHYWAYPQGIYTDTDAGGEVVLRHTWLGHRHGYLHQAFLEQDIANVHVKCANGSRHDLRGEAAAQVIMSVINGEPLPYITVQNAVLDEVKLYDEEKLKRRFSYDRFRTLLALLKKELGK